MKKNSITIKNPFPLPICEKPVLKKVSITIKYPSGVDLRVTKEMHVDENIFDNLKKQFGEFIKKGNILESIFFYEENKL